MCSDLHAEVLTADGVVSSVGDHPHKVLRQHKRNALPIDAELLLAMVEEVAEVDVEHLRAESGTMRAGKWERKGTLTGRASKYGYLESVERGLSVARISYNAISRPSRFFGCQFRENKMFH